jgi:hypothetical protein
MNRWHWIFACFAVAGCATEGAARFPSREELRKIEESPPPARTSSGSDREIDGWSLAGPLPDRIGTAPHAPSGPWEELMARAAEARPGVVFVSESMSCLGREAGRFFLANHALPSPRLRGFMANRCGSPTTEAVVFYNSGTPPGGAGDAEIFEHWHAEVEKSLDAQLKGGPLAGGLWFGRDGDRAVVMMALAPRRTELEPLSFRPNADGTVVLRGELRVPADRVEALINQGAHGFQRCANDASVKLPRFVVTCAAAPGDEIARIEMGAFPPGRITGPVALDLAVWPAHDPDSAWRAPPTSLPRMSGGALAENVLSLVNEARRQASLGPLTLAAAESSTAARVAPHFFAATLGVEPVEVADRVVLGLRAGWEIDGAVRIGYLSWGLAQSGDTTDLVGAMLDRPSGREALLAPAARQLAVGAFTSDSVLAGMVGTYELMDERDADVPRVVAQLTRLRQNAGHDAPRILGELGPSADQELRKLRDGRSPRGALESVMQLVAESHPGGVHGWIVEFTSVEAMELPPELLRAPLLRVAVAVAPYKPPREPWTRFVAVFVALDEVIAARPATSF